MKLLILITICMMAFPLHAKERSAQVIFKKNSLSHTYLISVGKKGSFIFFKENNKQTKQKKIANSEAERLLSEANRISWKSNYSRQTTRGVCSEYVRLEFNRKKPIIVCQENIGATAHAQGFLNKLSHIVR